MTASLRPLLLVFLLPVIATCQPPIQHGPQLAAVPLINPLPIPDAPNPRLRLLREEPREVRLLPDDEALAGAICRDRGQLLPPSGTLFGHIRFDEPSESELVAPPAQLTGGSCQAVHIAMIQPLAAMIAAATAEDPTIGQAISAISCHRSIERQTALFCAPSRVADRGYDGQARWIAPPGYSEHATGLGIDFGSRREEGCNLRPCFADTAAGRWLAANATRFGFEMSFPPGNRQGVAYEPWHFRYVGDRAAQQLFRSPPPAEDDIAR
jgi:zinc D-Ala-D-Ala carboxypeptidase